MASDEDLLKEVVGSLQHGRGLTAATVADLRQYPLHCIPAVEACRRVIYSTKGDWLLKLTDGVVPKDTTFLWRYGPLDASHRALLRAVVGSPSPPVQFVGDLDPLDMATFATLVADQALLAASYLGISDGWLNRCESDLAQHPGPSLDRVCIPMESAERAGLNALLQLPMDWSAIIGRRSLSLLQSGVKLELEGASNPAIYSRAFGEELRRSVFQ
jgi:hypothetical protein